MRDPAFLPVKVATVGATIAFVTTASAVARGDTRPPRAPQSERDAPASSSKRDDEEDRERFRIGPTVAAGFPRPIMIGGLVKFERLIGVGVEYSVLPRISVSGVETRLWGLAADARVFPFRGGFFLSLRAGWQELHARATTFIPRRGLRTDTLRGRGTYLNPRVGYLWTSSAGFSVGLDAGLSFPLGASLETTVPLSAADRTSEIVVSATRILFHEVTPTLDLLRVGMLF